MKKKKSEHIIASVVPGSIAEEMGVEAGDVLLNINDTEMEDILDYHYLTNDTYIVVLIRKPDGEEWELEIEKDLSEDLGINFENGLMDNYHSCHNKCVFCFIDQMPPGMRETLYFKDDDSRLSFLQGNYMTLTNLSDHDAERIIRYHMAPINVSVHTTNPELRVKMLHNRFAGDSLKRMKQFYDAKIEMNGQIVLCKGWNDGEELDRTIGDLAAMYPVMQSLSVVPIGLTRFREKLVHMDPIEQEDARDAIARIEKWQQIMKEKHGVYFVQASDELYIKADLPLPEEERYEGYIQLENGVGMVRLLLEESRAALEDALEHAEDRPVKARHVSLATGRLAYPYIRQIAESVMKAFPQVQVDVYAIRNDFFGEMITVSGLIVGQDLIAQLTGKDLGEALLVPINMFRSGEHTFLDDLTLEDAEKSLQVPLRIVKSDGVYLVHGMLYDMAEEPEFPLYQGYEEAADDEDIEYVSYEYEEEVEVNYGKANRSHSGKT